MYRAWLLQDLRHPFHHYDYKLGKNHFSQLDQPDFKLTRCMRTLQRDRRHAQILDP